MEIGHLCEAADPAPLLRKIKELIPAYTSLPNDKKTLSQIPDSIG